MKGKVGTIKEFIEILKIIFTRFRIIEDTETDKEDRINAIRIRK